MFKIEKAIQILEKSNLISQYDILISDEISKRAFYKIRCKLIPSKYKLDIKYIKTEKEFIYSYQVFYKNSVKRSHLSGDLLEDLKYVLNKTPNYL